MSLRRWLPTVLAVVLVAVVPATASAARPSLPPTYAGVRSPDLPVYSVAARMADQTGRIWRGRESVSFVNHESTSLSRVWLRLWANGPDGCAQPRGIVISSITGGHAVQVTAACSAVAIELTHAVKPHSRALISFDFVITVPQRSDRFGSVDGYTYLGNALPVLAIHDAAGWHLPPYTPNGESFYTTVADFTVKLDHPSGVRVPATGTSTDEPSTPGRTLTTVHAAHVRDFAWGVGAFQRVQGRDGHGVMVSVWWNPLQVGRTDALHELRIAKEAMTYDADAFGAYPYRESDVVLDSFETFGGMEYPGFVLSVPGDEPVAHEITHNWWYGIVGDDEYSAPWLDESFTEYVTLRVLKEDVGPCDLGAYPSAYRLTRGMDFWDNDSYAYGDVIYVDGPCALADLQARLGTSHMDHLLRTYALAHRFGFSTTHAFKLAAQHEAAGLREPVDLKSFWTKWRIDG